MSYRVVLSAEARADLEEIADYLESVMAPRPAREYLRSLVEAVERLGDTPQRGTVRDEVLPGLRAIPAHGSTVMVFQIDEALREVRGLRLVPGSADWMGRIRSPQ